MQPMICAAIKASLIGGPVSVMRVVMQPLAAPIEGGAPSSLVHTQIVAPVIFA